MSKVIKKAAVFVTLFGTLATFSAPLYAQFKLRLDERSNYGPAIVHHITEDVDVLIVAWTGTDDHINVMQSRDGIDWRAKIRLDETSDHPPALTSDGKYIYIAWTGRGNGKLNTMRSEDGIDWRTKIRHDDESGLEPGLAYLDGRIYMVWRGKGNHKINIM